MKYGGGRHILVNKFRYNINTKQKFIIAYRKSIVKLSVKQYNIRYKDRDVATKL